MSYQLEKYHVGDTHGTIEGDESVTSVCLTGPQKIIEILDIKDIPPAILGEKRQEIESLDAFTFFSGNPGDTIDNKGVHIWYINNYNSLFREQLKGNLDAFKIITKIQSIVHKSLGEIAEGTKLNLVPIKEDLGENFESAKGLFLHGFHFDLEEYKGVKCLSPRGYPDE